MKTKIVVADLSELHWVTDINKKLSVLFSYCLCTDHSQSNTFKGSVVSISHIIAQYQKNQTLLVNALQTSLQDYFSRNFDSASVFIDSTDNGNQEIILSISITVTDSDKTASLNQVVPAQLEGLKLVLEEINR